MKKIVLSAMAVLAVSTTSLSATQFFVDDKGQVFTTAGEGRKVLESKESSVFSKAPKLEFSGTHYFGYTSANPNTTASTADASVPTTVAVGSDTAKYAGSSNGFELRRNYLQVKGFFNDKDYWRVTLDTTKELASTTSYANAFVKSLIIFLLYLLN